MLKKEDFDDLKKEICRDILYFTKKEYEWYITDSLNRMLVEKVLNNKINDFRIHLMSKNDDSSQIEYFYLIFVRIDKYDDYIVHELRVSFNQ